MVRPESCSGLAGASPARVIAGEPGSRPQRSGVIPTRRVGRQKPRKREQGRGPQHQVNVAASSDYQPKGVQEGRAIHVMAKATDSLPVPERMLDLLGVETAARDHRTEQNRRDPTRCPSSGQTDAYKGQTEVAPGREGVRGAHSTCEGGDKPLEGRGPDLVMAVMEVSARAWLKNPKPPKFFHED
jgi:hypothetical protein